MKTASLLLSRLTKTNAAFRLETNALLPLRLPCYRPRRGRVLGTGQRPSGARSPFAPGSARWSPVRSRAKRDGDKTRRNTDRASVSPRGISVEFPLSRATRDGDKSKRSTGSPLFSPREISLELPPSALPLASTGQPEMLTSLPSSPLSAGAVSPTANGALATAPSWDNTGPELPTSGLSREDNAVNGTIERATSVADGEEGGGEGGEKLKEREKKEEEADKGHGMEKEDEGWHTEKEEENENGEEGEEMEQDKEENKKMSGEGEDGGMVKGSIALGVGKLESGETRMSELDHAEAHTTAAFQLPQENA